MGKKGKKKELKKDTKMYAKAEKAAKLAAAAAERVNAELNAEPIPDNVKETAAFFNEFIALVPPKFYFAGDEETPMSKRYMKKLKKGLTMPAHKLANYKHDKYDPDLQKSVQQLQEAKQARRDTGEDEEDEDEDDDEDEDEDEDGEESEPKAAGGNGQPALVENFSQEPLDRLRVKLQARIAELREARMPLKGDHKLLLLQRQEKKQRKKLEKKAKSSKLAAKKRTYQPPTANPFAGMTAEQTEEGQKAGVQFSKFEFGKRGGHATPDRKKEDKYSRLKKARAKKAKLQALAEENPGKAEHFKAKSDWSAAMKRAQGEKVQDDPTLLAKSVKRIEKQKLKSKTEWDERIRSEKASQGEKIKRRNENLAKRNQRGKTGGKTGGKKKDRAGFEGKKKKPSSKFAGKK